MRDKDTKENIIYLIRTALGNNNTYDLPKRTDWERILLLSQKQGVRGLVYEALETIKQKNTDVKAFPQRLQIMQCYAQTVQVEKMYAKHLSLTKDIVALWKKHGIKTIVFKGIAHSRYYPQPKHREFGDFDCYLIDGQGRCAYKQGNEIARKNGLIVDDDWYKHSHIAYKQLTI